MRIRNEDTNTVARLKMVYLVPINLILFLPMALYLGVKELYPDIVGGIYDAWNHQPRK